MKMESRKLVILVIVLSGITITSLLYGFTQKSNYEKLYEDVNYNESAMNNLYFNTLKEFNTLLEQSIQSQDRTTIQGLGIKYDNVLTAEDAYLAALYTSGNDEKLNKFEDLRKIIDRTLDQEYKTIEIKELILIKKDLNKLLKEVEN